MLRIDLQVVAGGVNDGGADVNHLIDDRGLFPSRGDHTHGHLAKKSRDE
jgi:hypothetical protein